MPRRVGVRPPRGAARLPPRAEPGPARREYLVRRELQAGCGRRILRRSRQSRGRAASHAAPSPSRMAPARAATKASRSAPRRLLYHRRTPQPPPPGGASRKSSGTWLHPRLAPGQSVVLGSPFPVGHSWHPQGSLPFGYRWAFSRLRTRGKYG